MSSATEEQAEYAGAEGIEREIGHDEFDPVGTVALIVVYTLIVLLLWVITYFVEFLGRGPTVV